MLVYNSRLIGTKILSLQASRPIGEIVNPIVDPDKLKIIAFYSKGPLIPRDENILDIKSIREYSTLGAVIDGEEELVGRNDVIHISKILDLNFDLIGLKVETKKGHKLGKVEDFTVLTDNFTVTQLIVKRPLIKSFLDSELIIPRSEIVEITDYKVIVKDEEKVIREKATTENFVPNFVNPFRSSEPSRAPAETKTPAELNKE